MGLFTKTSLKRKQKRQRPIIESLEPRILLSADLPGLDLPDIDPNDPLDADVDRILAQAEVAFPTAAADPDAAIAGELQRQAAAAEPLDERETMLSSSELPDDSRLELVIVDTNVPDYELLLADVNAVGGEDTRLDVVLIDPQRSGIAQISDILASRSGLGAIHMLSHGDDASIRLGSDTLDLALVQADPETFSDWGRALSEEGDILIYGCKLAASEMGEAFVESLAKLTGADVAASDDLTGNAEQGGDWDLEYKVGRIDATAAITTHAQDTWNGTLATYTVVNTNDSGAGSLQQAIIDANNNGEADVIDFNIGTGDAGYVDPTPGAPGSGDEYWSIQPTTVFSAITEAVEIDATTQSGFAGAPVIELDGSFASGADENGFTIETSGVTIRGFAINRFLDDAIEIDNQGGGNTIVGNYLGTDITGQLSGYGNRYGITVKSDGNTIGGTTAADRNIISGNTSNSDSYGIGFWQDADSNLVYGNYIGVGVDGTTAIGNEQGITFNGTNNSNQIGGDNTGEGNVIAFSDDAGIAVLTNSADNNPFLENAIHSNSGLGIDLGGDGVTGNDNNDSDTGPNDEQNFPVVTSLSHTAGSTTVNFDLNTSAAGNYRIDFYTSDVADSSGYGEGQTLVHSQVYSHTGGGTESFAAVFATSANAVISATATEDFGTSYGSTSEFSLARNAQGGYVLVVDTTSDVKDGTTTSVTNLLNNRGADGRISLREAIEAANADFGTTDLIQFEILDPLAGGVHMINVNAGGLPIIDDTVIIDGSTDSDYVIGSPVVMLNGASVAGDGLQLVAGSDGSTIRGLIISGFGDAGIRIDNSDNNSIVGNWIGTGADGTTDQGNATFGIELNNAGSNQIGGASITDRNVIAGNNLEGVSLWNSGATLNMIQGNYIGVDKTGNAALGNSGDGIVIGGGANNNTIGGDRTAFEGNVISGNAGALSDGIEIDNAGADNNKIYGNFIGTNFDGSAAIGNARYGIVVYNGVQGTKIGGTGTGHGNIVSGNNDSGIVIDGNGVISTTNNIIAGNIIGLDSTGTVDRSNVGHGVEIFGGATGNTIGGTTAAHRNVLSGNQGAGIHLTDGGGNIIWGNHIGTDSAGTSVLGNDGQGIYIGSTSDGNIIGGTTAGAENVISGNNSSNTATSAGIYVLSSTNSFQGNLIGTDITGTADLANNGAGIALTNSATNNLIGGTTAGAGNIIGFNNGDGVRLFTAAGSGNSILGNPVFSNGGDGIDLKNNGVTLNDANDSDTGPNSLQNFPVITQADLSGTDLMVGGSLDTDGPNTQYRIEFFGNAVGTQDATNGEGRNYLGSTTITTNGSGFGFFGGVILNGVTLSAGDYITATATRVEDNAQIGLDDLLAYGSTSEFAANVAIVDANQTPTTSGIADFSVNEDGGFTFIDLKAVFDDAEDADTALIYTITANTNPSLFDATSITGSGVLTLDYATDKNGAADITIRATDTGGEWVETTFTATIDPVNDAPLRTAGTVVNLNVDEDSGLTSLGLGSVAYGPGGDADESGQTLTYTVTAIPHPTNFGKIYLADGTTQVTTGTYTLTQLRGMQFEPAANATGGPSFFQYSVSDSGGTANGGVDTIAETIQITINPINDAPTFSTTNSTPTFTENAGTVSLFSATSVDAVEVGDLIDTLVVTVDGLADGSDEILMIDGQAIELTHLNNETTGTNGYDVSVSLSGATATVTVTKTGGFAAAATETLVDGLAYNNTSENPHGVSRVVTLTSVKDDGGTANGGADTKNIGIASLVTMDALNDEPVNNGSLPTDVPVLEGVSSGIDLSAVDFADPDHDNQLLTATLTTSTGGKLYASTDIDVIVAGSGTGVMTLTGGIADLNAFFDSATRIQYLHGTANTAGNNADTIQVQIRDNGNSGSGGGGDINLGTVNVDITNVNDAPSGTNKTVSTNEDTDYVFTTGDFGFSDVNDSPADNLASVIIASAPTNGTLYVDANGDGVVDGGEALAATDAVALGDIVANRLKFKPVADASGIGYDSFTFQVKDDGGTANSGVDTDPTANTITIDVTAINDSPVIGGANSGSVTEDVDPDVDTLLETAGTLTIADPDDGESSFQAATIVGTYGGLTIDASGNWVYQADNTQAPIQQLDAGQSVNDVLTVNAFDGTPHNVTITINGAEDAPVITGSTGASVTEDDVLTATGSLSIADVDTSDNPVSFPDEATTLGDNGYGDFQLTAGNWSYVLNNGHAAVQALGADGSLTDTHTFVASDGSTQIVSIVIAGAAESVPPPVVDPALPEPEPDPVPGPIDRIDPPPEPDDPVEPAGKGDPEPPLAGRTDPTAGEPDNAADSNSLLLNPLEPGEVFLSVINDARSNDGSGVQKTATPAVKPNTEAARTFLQELKSFWQDDSTTAGIEMSEFRLSQEFWNGLDKMASDLDESFEEQERKTQLSAEAAAGVGISLTAGFVNWALRAGSMVASFLAAMPTWRHFDPMPVLAADDKKKQDLASTDDVDEETREMDRDERIERLFSREE